MKEGKIDQVERSRVSQKCAGGKRWTLKREEVVRWRERKRGRHFLIRCLPDKSKRIKNKEEGSNTKEPEDKQGRLVLVRQGKMIVRQGASKAGDAANKERVLPPLWP